MGSSKLNNAVQLTALKYIPMWINKYTELNSELLQYSGFVLFVLRTKRVLVHLTWYLTTMEVNTC